MVVGAWNPEGVSCAQRISCHSPFRHSVLTVMASSLHHPGPVLHNHCITYFLSLLYAIVIIFLSCLYRVH